MNKATESVKVDYEAGIYIHGVDLDPEVVSAALGLRPTKSWKRNDISFSGSGKEIIRKVGLWHLSVGAPSSRFENTVKDLFDVINRSGVRICDISGVETAKMSVFWSVVCTSKSAIGATVVLSESTIALINHHGISLIIELSVTNS